MGRFFIAKRHLRWRYAVPFHILLVAIALALDDGILKCTADLSKLLRAKASKAEIFNETYPISVESKAEFRVSREAWHVNFKQLLDSVSVDLFKVMRLQQNGEVVPGEDYYDGPCSSMHPVTFVVFDVIAVLLMVIAGAGFVWQDTRSIFGADRVYVFVFTNIIIAIYLVLGILNFPIYGLMLSAVRLSSKLEFCVLTLKNTQRQMIGEYPFDDYFLRANVWDGQRFGVREPIFGYIVDKDLLEWVRKRVGLVLLSDVCLAAFLVYRSTVTLLVRWRKAIPSVVCIGVVFEGEENDKLLLQRIGSGCIVSSQRGLILTNWHLFQHFYCEPAIVANAYWGSLHPSSPPLSHISADSVKRGLDAEVTGRRNSGGLSIERKIVDTNENANMVAPVDFDTLHPLPPPTIRTPPGAVSRHTSWSTGRDTVKTLKTTSSKPKTRPSVMRHLSRPDQRCRSIMAGRKGVRIIIGTSERGHPRWQYEAELMPQFDSPSADYESFGLDLSMLRITKRVNFVNLRPVEGKQEGGLSFKYSFSGVTAEAIDDIRTEDLVKCEIGKPESLRAGDDSLRLLGYPASGGYQLSVLTGFFTSLSFDYADQRRGAWLNININLPHGGSGGAAVNSQGELVGICTQTLGDLTNIRSISEAVKMIDMAKRSEDGDRIRRLESGDVSHCKPCRALDCTLSSGLFERIRHTVRELF